MKKITIEDNNENKKYYDPIIKFIPTGKENAIHMNSLAGISGYDVRIVRQGILDARRDGNIILSGSCGYWLTDDPEEIERYLKLTHNRAVSTLSIISGIRRTLKKEKAKCIG